MTMVRPRDVASTNGLSRVLSAGLAFVASCGSQAAMRGLPDDGGATPGDGSPFDSSSIDGRLTDGRAADGQLSDSQPVDGCPVSSPPLAGPGHTPGNPGLGAHRMSYCKYLANLPPSLSTPPMATQPSGSTIIVGVGRGDLTKFVSPTDNYGNAPYQLMDGVRPYNHPYENSGTAVYVLTSATGGSDFQVTNATRAGAKEDEITLAAVEIVEGTRIADHAWNVVDSAPLTSGTVTTTRAATLVAFWWGSGFPGTPQSATPNNDFVLIDTNAYETGSFVQGAVAVKNVTAPDTYDVTWTATPAQGAQMWLIAVEK